MTNQDEPMKSGDLNPKGCFRTPTMKAMIPLKVKLPIWMSLLVSCILLVSGCAVPTKKIQKRHWALNSSIRSTTSEQLLLNIVRLRYDESPFFLQLSSISTTFAAQQSLGVSGQIPDGGPNALGLSGSLAYTESPTVTWSLPDSSEYYGRLLGPMGADQLTALAQSGFDASRVFRMGIKKMNRLRNQQFRVNEGIVVPASYTNLIEALGLVDELTSEGVIDLAYGVKSTTGAGKIPLDKLDTRAIPEGLAYGLQFMTRDDPNTFEPLKLFKPLFLRFSKASDNDPRAQRLRELLNLDSTKYSFGIVDTGNSGVEQLRAESGKVSQVFDPDVHLAEIVVNNRSMMEVLYFASTSVEVPESDLAHGRVRSNEEHIDSGWLMIHSSATEPPNAWIKIKFRDTWYYILDNDLNSRSSFSLLDAMFASIVGNVPGAKPLLTLPVK